MSVSTQPTLGTVSVSEPGKHRLPLTCGDKSRVNTETRIPAASAAAPGRGSGTKGASTSSRGLPHRLWGQMSDAAPNSRSRLSCPVRRGRGTRPTGSRGHRPLLASRPSHGQAGWLRQLRSSRENVQKSTWVFLKLFIRTSQPATRYLTVSKATENRADWTRFWCVRAVWLRLHPCPSLGLGFLIRSSNNRPSSQVSWQ